MAEPFRSGIHVDAPPERVFAYFTDPVAIVAWLGQRAQLEPRPGGVFSVRVRGVDVRGEYLELDPPRRLLFSWGTRGAGSSLRARAPSRCG